jgi:hypothetical protein
MIASSLVARPFSLLNQIEPSLYQSPSLSPPLSLPSPFVPVAASSIVEQQSDFTICGPQLLVAEKELLRYQTQASASADRAACTTAIVSLNLISHLAAGRPGRIEVFG